MDQTARSKGVPREEARRGGGRGILLGGIVVGLLGLVVVVVVVVDLVMVLVMVVGILSFFRLLCPGFRCVDGFRSGCSCCVLS